MFAEHTECYLAPSSTQPSLTPCGVSRPELTMGRSGILVGTPPGVMARSRSRHQMARCPCAPAQLQPVFFGPDYLIRCLLPCSPNAFHTTYCKGLRKRTVHRATPTQAWGGPPGWFGNDPSTWFGDEAVGPWRLFEIASR